MTRFSKVLLFVTALSLGACSHYSDDLASLDGAMKSSGTTLAYNTAAPQDIAPAAGGAAMSGGSLNAFLARDYYELARYENDKAYDYKAAKQYTQKAMMAQKGQSTGPAKISSYDIPAARLGDLTKARAELVGALKQQNTPENAPALAKAQSSFDCWLERAEEADDDMHFAECKNGFDQSMAMLVAPAAGDAAATTVYTIGFMQTSAMPDEASQKRLEYIAQYLMTPENAPLRLSLSAPADETGMARIAAVQKALTDKGVDAGRITATAPAYAAMPAQAQSVDTGVKVAILGSTQINTVTTTTYIPVAPAAVSPAAHAPDVMPRPAPVTQ